MGGLHLPGWLQAAVAASGGMGLFLVAFLDSTFVPFPSANDLLLIDLSIQFPARMPYYAALATLGSLVGCVVLYMIVRKGGEVAFHKRAGRHAAGVRHWVEHNGFVSMMVAALLPPPTPFKIFVMGAGALGMPLRTFVLALLIARTVRFYGEGYLAVHYGPQATVFLAEHKLALFLGTLLVVLVLYFLVRLLMRRPSEE
jgi:membrane protein YqaA with SNARE-associated domain